MMTTVDLIVPQIGFCLTAGFEVGLLGLRIPRLRAKSSPTKNWFQCRRSLVGTGNRVSVEQDI